MEDTLKMGGGGGSANYVNKFIRKYSDFAMRRMELQV